MYIEGDWVKKVLKKYDELNTTIKENNENKIIIATSSCIGEGFDDSTLEVLFLTMPISSVNRIVQYTGRLHRKNENKKENQVNYYSLKDEHTYDVSFNTNFIKIPPKTF